jgi:hypothetical protein
MRTIQTTNALLALSLISGCQSQSTVPIDGRRRGAAGALGCLESDQFDPVPHGNV